MARLIVLGAGPAGLGAALWAAQAGHEVVVLEREPAVGGLTASFEVAGVRVDHGSHRLHPSTAPPVMALLRAAAGAGAAAPASATAGSAWAAGGSGGRPGRATSRGCPPGLAAGVAWDTATAWARAPAGAAATFAEVARSAVGPRLADAFYAPYARKIWGLPPEELDGEQARRRIGVRSPTGLLRRVVGPRAPGAGTFYYPAGGFGRIAESLAEACVDAGVDLRCSRRRDPARPATPRTSTVTTRAGASREGMRSLSTVPVGVLARLAGPAEVAVAAGGLGTRAWCWCTWRWGGGGTRRSTRTTCRRPGRGSRGSRSRSGTGPRRPIRST